MTPVPIRPEGVSDAEKIREVIRILNAALDDCHKLLREAEKSDAGHAEGEAHFRDSA